MSWKIQGVGLKVLDIPDLLARKVKDNPIASGTTIALSLMLAIFLGVIFFLPVATCPWCDGEIKHVGGRLRYCTTNQGQWPCGGSGRTTLYYRWRSFMFVRWTF